MKLSIDNPERRELLRELLEPVALQGEDQHRRRVARGTLLSIEAAKRKAAR